MQEKVVRVWRDWKVATDSGWRRIRDSVAEVYRQSRATLYACLGSAAGHDSSVDVTWSQGSIETSLFGTSTDSVRSLSLELRDMAGQLDCIQGPKDPPLTESALPVIVRRDNDIAFRRDSSDQVLAAPEPVAVRIRALVAAEGAEELRRGSSIASLRSWFGPTYRIRMPDHRYLFIFRIRLYEGEMPADCLIVFDTASGAVTQNPFLINAVWTENFWTWESSVWPGRDPLLKPPFVAFDDVNQDGRQEIVYEQRVHNGTDYNAVIYHYLDVGPDLALHRVLAHEARVVDEGTFPEEGLITRTIRKTQPNELLLETVREGPTSHPKSGEKLGDVLLRSDGPDRPFHVVKRRAVDPKYDSWLVSFASNDDDTSLRDGYDSGVWQLPR